MNKISQIIFSCCVTVVFGPAVIGAETNDSLERRDSTVGRPRITVVESQPLSSMNSILRSDGSVWCNGQPTIWMFGHDNAPESPACQHSGGAWYKPDAVKLSIMDSLNRIDAPEKKGIDRHGCVAIDVNRDEIEDLVCIVGANKGQGLGFNEVYLTRADGTLDKMLEGHGLNLYPTVRTRMVVSLRAFDGEPLVFIAGTGAVRPDGLSNLNRMYRLKKPDARPRFVELVAGAPWLTPGIHATCLEVADLDGNQTDDLVLCDRKGTVRFYLQSIDGHWSELDLESEAPYSLAWKNVRVEDVSGDGIVDLVVAMAGHRGRSKKLVPWSVRIFEGNAKSNVLFDFSAPILEYFSETPLVDVEIVDVNRDVFPDIYVVRDIENSIKLCHRTVKAASPLCDTASDVVLLGASPPGLFTEIPIELPEVGCGGSVLKWRDGAIVRDCGSMGIFGKTYLLEWLLP